MSPDYEIRRRSMTHWTNKVVLVTGASAGLGVEIARAFAQRGAKVVLAARGAEALEQTAAQLRQEGFDASGIPADVTKQDDVERLVRATVERHGRLDVLVNNAGKSARRAVLDTTAEDFAAMMELNLLGTVRCTRAAAPHLLKAQGCVVNIGSLAAKSAGLYLGAYPASKFAVAAYSQQLRLELGPQGLHVLLVCPGPIARSEPRVVDETELAGLPDSARKPGGGVKTKAIDPAELAREIVAACQARRSEIIRPAKARLLFLAMQISPRLADWLVRRNM